VIFLDTETTGLDPRADRLVLVGVAGPDGVPRLLEPDRDREVIQAVLELETMFVGHNVGFDMAFLEHAGYRIPDPTRWQDTQLVAHVAGERKPGQATLRRLTQQLIEAGIVPSLVLEPEDAVKAWLLKARRDARKQGLRRPEKGDAPGHLLNPYLRADVLCTRAIADYYGARVDGQGGVLELERRCLGAVYAAQRRGVPLDLDAAHELRDRTLTTVVDLRARLFELAGGTFNVNAARQIEAALRDRGVDLSSVPRTPRADLPMFTAQTLQAIDDELARALLEYREEKKLADYVAGLYTHTHGDRLYGTFKLLGSETGRMSSAGPNLQNIPASDLRVRYVICAGAGRVLVDADQDNVELRVLAAYAPGGELERAFADGVDLHQRTADELGVTRDVGKTLNYATLYGAGAPLIARRLGVEHAQAKEILDRWYGLYPEVAKLKWGLTRRVRQHGYIRSAAGRRHHFDEPNHMMINRLISGTCAEIFKAALIELHEADVPMVLLVHDEVLAEVPEVDADRVAGLLERALARGMGRVRELVAQAKTGQRWSDFKEPGWSPGEAE
jgi:DNA polymerase I-like protein with 3'-5' exonuclease and polymerase domains